MERDDDLIELLRSASADVPRFHVHEAIERTGEGVTFRAWDESLAREVAIRTVDSDPARRGIGPAERRLIAEALVTGGLSHPGIVPVHELALDAEGRPYFTTRLLRATTFRDVITRVARGERDFTLARAIDALRGACETIAYAHSRGATHGTLSPESILVGEFGETYVTGWGNARAASPEADVHAAGALLTELFAGLAGREPPRELAAIRRKALAREAGARYAGMNELAADLRAWLEQRVVRAHRTGALAELGKWIARNRATAALSALALLVAIGGLSATEAIARKKNRELSATRDTIASRLADIERLKALKSVRDLIPQADAIWPAVPENLPAMRRWLAEALELVADRPVHLARLAVLDPRASARDAPRADARDSPRANARDSWWRDSLEQLVASLDALAADTPDRIGTIAEMKRRIASAETIEKRSIDDAAADWSEAIAALETDPRFQNVQVDEQLGLVPIGPDPESGLWEFWHVDTGERPQRDPQTDRIVVTGSMGLVFVLLPGGTLHFRTSKEAPGLPTIDPDATTSPSRRDVTLDPFFLSKFEMTQGQWLRVTGSNPSGHSAVGGGCPKHHDLSHPVEIVSFEAAAATLRRLGLKLSTHAQWQYAASAGTRTTYWTGDDVPSLKGACNLADRTFASQMSAGSFAGEAWDDGYFCTAPVGRFRPNPFGLHDTIGNVEELLGEAPFLDVEVDLSPGDGARTPRGIPASANVVLFEGGSFARTSRNCKITSFGSIGVATAIDSLGLRPARTLTRLPRTR